jgi:chromosome segregation ATPase
MELNEGQDIYLKQFIQRQESLFLDLLRKNIDLEIRLTAISASLKDLSSKYEESQKQVDIQNEMMQQAAVGVESLSKEKQQFEKEKTELNKKIEDLKKSLQDYKNEKQQVIVELETIKNAHANYVKRYEDLNDEYLRQTQELSNLYKENEKLKTNQPINKRKPKAILPPDEF